MSPGHMSDDAVTIENPRQLNSVREPIRSPGSRSGMHVEVGMTHNMGVMWAGIVSGTKLS
jgi:hypothetical protein